MLALYCYIRMHQLEDRLPLPRLYQVIEDGIVSTLWFEYLGLDVAKHNPLTSEQSDRTFAESVRDLTEVGIELLDNVGPHNWCLIKRLGQIKYRAFLVDVGRLRLPRQVAALMLKPSPHNGRGPEAAPP